ncbi:MAG: hypothetical protein ACRDGT_01325 [Candidatus Limnocylindria bacterium]
MGLAIGVLAVGLGALVLRPPAQPGDATRARDRLAQAFVAPTAAPAPTPLAVRSARPRPLPPLVPRPALPPPLTFPVSVASTLPAESSEASRASVFAVGEGSRQAVYEMPDGRTVVVRQSSASGRPMLASYALSEGSVRGYPAQFITTRSRSLRSMIAWSEGTASYLMYSGTMTIRDLTRLADHLR